jgi:hypothetical protein
MSAIAWLAALLLILFATVTAITAAREARGAEPRAAHRAYTMPMPTLVDPCAMGACW